MKPNSARLREVINKAKREGWYRWVRQGKGEEADERAMLNGCWFDQRRADHWFDYVEKYGTLTEGAFNKQPFNLLDWQATDSGRVFGWVKHNEEWGYTIRRFKFWYEEAPKKQGKTPFISTVGNYLFFADCISPNGDQRQINLHLCATSRKQAERCLLHAIRQIRNKPSLEAKAKIRKLEGFQSVQYLDNFWTVLAANPESSDGVNGHCLADEIHRWKGFEFYNALKWMLASQPEGLFVAITTAGEDGENVCKALHDHTIEVNAGRSIDESFYGQIYGAERLDDPHEEKTWFKANPSLGTKPESPIKLSSFRQDYEAAKGDPYEWANFLRLRLGYWTSSSTTWIDTSLPEGINDWDAGPTERKKARCQVDCFEGFDDAKLTEVNELTSTLAFDLAAVRDTVAATIAIQDHDFVVRVRPAFWLPEKEAYRQRKRVNYFDWRDLGAIKLTKGNVIDYRVVLNDMIELIEKFRVTRFYYDPLFQAEWFTQELEQATGAERIQFPQTIKQYAPLVKECERRMIEHTILHNANPVLHWQLLNAVAYENANGDKRIIKPKRGSYKKVDGVQALIMSLQDSVLEREIEDDSEEAGEWV